MNEFDETEEEYDDGRPHPMHRLGKILGRVITIGCFLVIALLLFRMCSQNKIPESIETISVNDKLSAAYREKGDGLSVIYQDHEIYSVENNVRVDENGKTVSNAGKAYFAVPKVLFFTDIDQVQLVLRYNSSTLKYLTEDYASLCPELPDRSENVYDITLVKVTDLTPDISTDNEDKKYLNEERFSVTDMISDESGLHNFRRLTFDGLELDGALSVYLCIYYKEAVDYDAPPYATVTVYESGDKDFSYKLTKADKKALEGAN